MWEDVSKFSGVDYIPKVNMHKKCYTTEHSQQLGGYG